MKILLMTIAGALLLVANSVAAQPTPSTHGEHHAAAKKRAGMSGQQCCCEKEMHQMMSMMHEMMGMHKGMHEGMNMPGEGDMKMPMQAPQPDQQQPH